MGRHSGAEPKPARDLAAPSLDTLGVAVPHRPRRGGVVTTGQIPVTRRTGGPTGTAPIAIVAPQPRLAPPSRLRTPPPPVRRPRRRPGRALVSTLAVAGLLAVSAIPAFAVVARDPGQPQASDGDEQEYRTGAGVDQGQAALDTARGLAPAVVAVASWVRPVVGELGDPFGPRPIQPVPGVSLFHRGQDIVAGCGSTIRAAADGVVEYAGWDGTYGNWILVAHGGGIETGYAHEEALLVAVGQHVHAGQAIGRVGETGAATGCHLHLEVHIDGTAVNPVPFFTARGVALGG